MLEIKNVCKTFNAGTINEKKALQNLNLTLKDAAFCKRMPQHNPARPPPIMIVENLISANYLRYSYHTHRHKATE